MAKLKIINRDALTKAVNAGSIPTQPVKGSTGGNWGSSDPNYPLFRLTAHKGKTVLMYIPNVTKTFHSEELGDYTDLDMDNYSVHNVVDPSGRAKYGIEHRCVKGITMEEFGLDGTCDYCNLSFDFYEVIKGMIDNDETLKGMDRDSKEFKEKQGAIFDRFKRVGGGSIRYTLPVALVETTLQKEGNRTTHVPVLEDILDSDGNPTGKKKPVIHYYYFDLSEGQYERLATGYRKSFDMDVDYDALVAEEEGYDRLFNSWIQVEIPDKEKATDVGKETSFYRASQIERLRGVSDDAPEAKKKLKTMWAGIEKMINAGMFNDEIQFDSINAMIVLTRNRLETYEDIEDATAPHREYLETLKSMAQGGTQATAIESQQAEAALDNVLGGGDAGAQPANAIASGNAQGTAPQSTEADNDDLFG